jgi:toxin ParE1/3/4
MIWSLRQTLQSEQDYVEIWSYIAADNPVAANLLLERLDKAFRTLAVSPFLGVSLDSLRKNHRYITMDGYILIYCTDVAEQVCEFVRVLNGAQNWRKALVEPIGI